MYCCGVSALNAQDKRDFKTFITTALANGQRRIVVPPGTWYMDLRDGVPLTLRDLSDVAIIADGVNIICNTPTQAIAVQHCENLRMSGFSIDYDPLPFTQGKIVALDTLKRMWLDVRIYEGYRTDMIEGRLPDRFQVFDQHTHHLKKNLYTYFSGAFSKVEKRGDHLFRFYKSGFNKDACEDLHDEVVFSLPYPGKTRAHTFVISRSKNVRLENITLFSGNCFGFFEMECDHNIYDHCRVTKKRNDPLRSAPRLRSNNADAFHSKFAVHGPEVTHCEFLYQGDDGIAINTSFYRVISGKANEVYVDSDTAAIKIKAGHRVRFVDYDGKVLEDAKVVAVSSTGSYPQAALDSMFHLFGMKTGNRKTVVLLTLDKAVSATTGSVVSSLDMAGAGFIVKNNKVGYTRARGILIKSSGGVIKNNTVTGCELGGIVLAPELNWLEAGFSRDVLIQHNLVKDCMFANSSYGIEQAAPISVVAVNAQNRIAPAGGFMNIRIIDNTIENSPMPAIMVTSINGGEVVNNHISISREIVRSHGRKLGVNNTAAIWQKNAEHLLIRKNKTVNQ